MTGVAEICDLAFSDGVAGRLRYVRFAPEPIPRRQDSRTRHWAQRVALTAAAVLALGLPRAFSTTVPTVNTLDALGQALTACFHAPEGSAGSQLTVLVTLRRDGAVLGKPRITFAHLIGPDVVRRAFAKVALASLEACTPVAVTPGLGGAIAGRPMTIRFIGGGRAQAI